MSDFSEDFLAHLEGDTTTLCHCWRLTRSDGVVQGFTDHDAPISFAGTAFRPETGFSASEARTTLGLSIDTVDVEGAISSDMLDFDDVLAGRFDGARAETFLVNWAKPSQRALLRIAHIGKITREDGVFRAELQSPAAFLDQPRGRFFRRGCDAELGDAKCAFDLNASGYSATATAGPQSEAGRVVVNALQGFEDGWFTDGVLEATSGAQAGKRWRIVGHRRENGRTVLDLWPAQPAPVEGDGFKVTAGCDKSFATCKAKFANHLNFRGFPHLPGNDAAYGYASEGDLFDGSPLVP
ncbi:DUF2163 domain-containing protein [Mesorhizobium xinjiangense]|uniref:DUF2163 domain-containing protein n=1 Tax=Mesorhizobium xinjiangense TaxID=2678685 RepID=UPI0012EE7BB7|nr:DUF2163 domain-containing protein [Mesorhizobium xinjiangense]